MSMWEPKPVVKPLLKPRQSPELEVPSHIGEGQGNWLFYNGAGGKLFDFSGYDNHGEIYEAKWTDEHSASWALSFVPADAYVEVPDSPSLNEDIVGEMTLYAWVYWNGGDPGKSSGAVMVDNRGNDGAGFIKDQYVDSDNSMVFTITVGGSKHDLDSPDKITEDEWILWCGRYDGSEISILRNASVVNSVADSGDITTTDDPLVIGSRQPPPFFVWPGFIGLVLLYNEAHSDDKIKAFYQATKPLYTG